MEKRQEDAFYPKHKNKDVDFFYRNINIPKERVPLIEKLAVYVIQKILTNPVRVPKNKRQKDIMAVMILNVVLNQIYIMKRCIINPSYMKL